MSGFRGIEPFPRAFLSLAPATSDSYPSNQKAAADSPASATTSPTLLPHRTSSSASSDSMKSLRYLKLGPVHWGEHRDEHKGDFHEVASPKSPSAFLSLAPATSDSYPTVQAMPSNTVSSPSTSSERRSSSASSGSDEAGKSLRYLKLGPVHWGEHRDEHKSDFHDV